VRYEGVRSPHSRLNFSDNWLNEAELSRVCRNLVFCAIDASGLNELKSDNSLRRLCGCARPARAAAAVKTVKKQQKL
jgi:hypothetical protein